MLAANCRPSGLKATPLKVQAERRPAGKVLSFLQPGLSPTAGPAMRAKNRRPTRRQPSASQPVPLSERAIGPADRAKPDL